MTPKYKLTYFDFTGLGEPIRFLLNYGGLDFEDNRISQEDWPSFKSHTPLGQMPLLELEDGKVLYQNTSIARYLGNVIGLAGETPLENWEIDSIADALTDLRFKLIQSETIVQDDKKQFFKENFVKETLPFYFNKFEELAKENGGHLAIGKLTWADLYFVAFQELLCLLLGNDVITDEYPNLQNVRNNVLCLPPIRAWLQKRPHNEL